MGSVSKEGVSICRRWLSVYKCLVFGLVLLPVVAHGQSLADDIQQLTLDYEKLKQEKRILTDMYKGYELVREGYEQIKGISEGNFHLHQGFLNALLAVSPTVRNYYKVSQIINNEVQLVREYQSARNWMAGPGGYSTGSLLYYDNLYAGLLSASLSNLDELAMLMTDGNLRMSDEERLAAVDRIDGEMSGRLAFLSAYNQLNAVEAGQRGVQWNDVQALMGVYGIK
jgi:hypothetical protein